MQDICIQVTIGVIVILIERAIDAWLEWRGQPKS
jgi:hypothetical protein